MVAECGDDFADDGFVSGGGQKFGKLWAEVGDAVTTCELEAEDDIIFLATANEGHGGLS